MGGSGSSSGSSRGARTWTCGALERARRTRAWTCGSPERTVGRVWLALWPAANPGAPGQSEKCRALVGSELEWRGSGVSSRSSAGRGQWHFENYGLWIGKNCKMVMLRSGINIYIFLWYAPERKFRVENEGLSRGTYPICIWKHPPPPLAIGS